MEKKIVLTGIARSKGKAAGEAMVFSHRIGMGVQPCRQRGRQGPDGRRRQPGQSVTDKIVVYPT